MNQLITVRVLLSLRLDCLAWPSVLAGRAVPSGWRIVFIEAPCPLKLSIINWDKLG